MSTTSNAATSHRRCTVTGRRYGDGQPMSLVCEAWNSGQVVLFPHGLERDGVVLNPAQQRELGQWLLRRPDVPEPRDG